MRVEWFGLSVQPLGFRVDTWVGVASTPPPPAGFPAVGVWGLGFRVQGLGVGFEGLGFRVLGIGNWVLSFGF